MEREGKRDGLFEPLEGLLRGIGMALIELNVFQGKRSAGVQVKAVVMASQAGETGIEDCAKAHRLVMPRLELAFPGKDVYLEVSSPGIDRLIKDCGEFEHYVGREVRCYLADIEGWVYGVLRSADSDGIVVESDGVETAIAYKAIAKARLGAPKAQRS